MAKIEKCSTIVRLVLPKLVVGANRSFQLAGTVRVDDTVVHRAIREAVVNMMIHSDYLITGVLKIVKTDQGFEFSNPGNLKLPVRAIYEGGHSVARNPRIQTMFRMIGYGDNIGSGFPTILRAWGEENWRKPDLWENEELHQVELKLWMISLMPRACTEQLTRQFGQAYLSLPKEQQLILATAQLEQGVTNARLQSILNLHSTDIGHILAGLVEQGLLISDKKGRWTRYCLNEEHSTQPEQLKLENFSADTVVLKNATDRMIYEYIKKFGSITTAKVVEITNIRTQQGASVALGRLRKADLVKKVRQGHQVEYQLK